ncbi:MAG: hypothetical protein QOH31_2084 [Verrucomicrobiota bacterium]
MLCGQNDYVIQGAYRLARPVVGVPRIDQTLHIISALLFAHRKLAEEGKFSLGSYLAICWCDPPSHFAVREETYVRGSRLEC